MLNPSNWLLSYIKSKEKFRPTAYLPTRNDKLTIGYGHTKGVKQGDTCTQAMADLFLRNDLDDAVGTINRLVAVDLRQNQFDALCSLVFNIGDSAFQASHLLKHVNAQQWDAAADEFPKWDHQGSQELEGLRIRRNEERAVFLWRAPEPFPIHLPSAGV